MVTTSLPLMETQSSAYICPYDQACSYLEWAAKELKLDQGIVEILSHPRKVVTVSIPIKMDNGEVRVFPGHRVQHSDILGPYKGSRKCIFNFQQALSKDTNPDHSMLGQLYLHLKYKQPSADLLPVLVTHESPCGKPEPSNVPFPG